jgi:hypothetical protein
MSLAREESNECLKNGIAATRNGILETENSLKLD